LTDEVRVKLPGGASISGGEKGGGEGGHPLRAALCRGRHLEGQKYEILKCGRFWQIGVCTARRIQRVR